MISKWPSSFWVGQRWEGAEHLRLETAVYPAPNRGRGSLRRMMSLTACWLKPFFVEHSNHRKSFQQICAVRGLIKTVGQIQASSMQHLMPAILPQETAGHVIYFALVGYEGRCPVFAVVLDKFFFRKSWHIQDAFGHRLWVMDKGETLICTGSPRCRT